MHRALVPARPPRMGGSVVALTVEDDGRLLGINDRAELAEAEWGPPDADQRRPHGRRGDDARPIDGSDLDATVTLAEDVTIEPNVIMRGRTSVGEGSVIGAGSQVVDATIGRELHRSGRASSSRRSSRTGARVGPFSHLRPGSVVGPDAEVGNFAELKNAPLGRGVKQHHMSYLGDAELGAGTNVGAGTITANYDGNAEDTGRRSGNGSSSGSTRCSALRSTLGDDSRTGAGAVVTEGRARGQARGRRPGPDPRTAAAR